MINKKRHEGIRSFLSKTQEIYDALNDYWFLNDTLLKNYIGTKEHIQELTLYHKRQYLQLSQSSVMEVFIPVECSFFIKRREYRSNTFFVILAMMLTTATA